MSRATLQAVGAIAALAGIALFASGFFLTRVELGHVAACGGTAGATGRCLPAPTFDKLVVLVIDAWRHDFADPAGLTDDPAARPHYRGQMPLLADTLRRSAAAPDAAHSARLFRFVADAPTVTQQRLKGLLTGSLPTFIDVSANFASGHLADDNVIAQLVGRARACATGAAGNASTSFSIFVGDDTWLGLFPHPGPRPTATATTGTGGTFDRTFAFPSFNVYDLDTVDAGVETHLPRAIAGDYGQWHLIVAHGLGVDHVGHRHTPHHPAMARKLEQMDRLIDDTLAAIDDRTLVAVLGDHGMTGDGNHGGASPDEVDAALLLAARRPGLFADSAPAPTISQLDFAATIASLLGVAIPFSSLGTLAPGLALGPPNASPLQLAYRELDALLGNFQQVADYVAAYAYRVPTFSAGQVSAIVRDTRAQLAAAASALDAARCAGGSPSCRTDVDRDRCHALVYGDTGVSGSGLRGWAASNATADGASEWRDVEQLRCLARVHGGWDNAPHATEHAAVIAEVAAASAAIRLALARIGGLFRELWTQFHVPTMVAGIILLVTALASAITLGASNAAATVATPGNSSPSTGHTGRGRFTGLRMSCGHISVSLVNTVGLLLVVLRADALFTDTLLVAEPALMAGITSGFVALAALRRVSEAATWSRREAVMVARAAAAVAAVLVSVQRHGALWPFPATNVATATSTDTAAAADGSMRVETGVGESSIGWAVDPHALPGTTLLISVAMTMVSALAGRGRAAARLGHALHHAAVGAYWAASAAGLLAGSWMLRIALPWAVYGASLARAAGATAAGDDTNGMRWFAAVAPALALLHGPGAAYPLAALAVFLLAWGAEMYCDEQPSRTSPQSRCWRRVATSLFNDGSWVHAMALAAAVAHWYAALGHGNQFNTLHFAAAFVGLDTDVWTAGTVLLLCNLFAAHLLLIGAVAAVGTRGAVRTAQRALVLPLLAVACSATWCCIARRHLMVWALFAPKFVFDAVAAVAWLALVAAVTAAASRPCRQLARGSGEKAD